MPRAVLDEKTVDPFAEEVAEEIAAATEREADLVEAGIEPDEELRLGEVKVAEGRAAARMAYTWNGTPSLIPLAWNPDGTRNDGGMAYLLKRHCLCCGHSGFKGRKCPECVHNACTRCRGKRDQVIKNFYLDPEEVPNKEVFYGDVDCFLAGCIRRGASGFKTQRDMRVHAASRHKLEYQAYREAQEEDQASEVADLRARLDQLTGLLITQSEPVKQRTPEEQAKIDKRMEAMRAGRERKKKEREAAKAAT